MIEQLPYAFGLIADFVDFLYSYRSSFLFLLLVYLLLIATSGYVVKLVLRYAKASTPDSDGDGNAEDTGKAIGKTENAIVLSLVFLEAYTALGIIFAAKSFVRAQDTASEDTTYYLTGTLANFTYSLLYSALFRAFLDVTGTTVWSL